MNCLQNIITPLNPCLNSVPCTKITDAACVEFNGMLSCVGGTNPRLDTILVTMCGTLNSLYLCPSFVNMTLTNTAEVFISATPKYMKDRCGNIQFIGWILQTAAAGILGSGINGNVNPGAFTTLPVGFRPSSLSVFPVEGEVIGSITGTHRGKTLSIWVDPGGDCYFQVWLTDSSDSFDINETVEVSFNLAPVKFTIL